MAEYPAPLEQIFQRVELESELRAQQADNVESLLNEKVANAATMMRNRQKRRGSISISRIGQLSDADISTKPGVPSSPNTLVFAHNSPMYQAQLASLSSSSVASGASQFSDDHAHKEDDNHVTQMHHIVGKKSFTSKLMPRRLSRANSSGVMPSWSPKSIEPTVVIGVSVQEATVHVPREAVDGDGEIANHSRRASIAVHRPMVKQPSQSSLRAHLAETTWLSRVKSLQKSFSLKLRRKGKAAEP